MDDSTEIDIILLKFHPDIRENIKQLLNEKFGLEEARVSITPYLYKTLSEDNTLSYSRHFLLKIQYCLSLLQWDIILNPEDYSFGPDFDFNDEHFLANPTGLESFPSLTKWNVKNPNSLTSVINEFVSLYKNDQYQRLEQEHIFSNVFHDYMLLLSNEVVSREDTEIFIENNSIVHILISIKINFSELPAYLQQTVEDENNCMNPSINRVLLKVSYLQLNGSNVQTSLQLSSDLKQIIGILRLPRYKKDNGLINYVTAIIQLIKDRVDQISICYKLKSRYITQILNCCGSSIIEYDHIQFSKMTFLFENNAFHCLVSINLGKKFPEEKPGVHFQSLYHTHLNKPITEVLNLYRYSPRWKPEEMVIKLIEDLSTAISNFQTHCESKIQG